MWSRDQWISGGGDEYSTGAAETSGKSTRHPHSENDVQAERGAGAFKPVPRAKLKGLAAEDGELLRQEPMRGIQLGAK
jgi:hypothetical protein